MTIHASNTDHDTEQYQILRHLFHLAVENSPKDWQFFGSCTNTDDNNGLSTTLTEYEHAKTGDRIKAQSWDRVDGQFTKHLFTFTTGEPKESERRA